MEHQRHLFFWLVAGLLLIATLALLREILLPFVAGIAIAYFLNPIADRLEHLGLPRIAAAALIVGIGGLAVGLAIVFLVPLLFEQARQLIAALPAELERLQAVIEEIARARLGTSFPAFKSGLDNAMQQISSGFGAKAAQLLASVWSRGLAILNIVALLLVTPLVVFYLLVDWHPMLERVSGWLPVRSAPTVRRLASEINDAVSAFVRGQGIICIILGLLYALGLTWAGIRYGLVVGLAAGILTFVPFVGWALGIITASLLAIVQYWPDATPLIKVIAIFAAGQALDAGFLSPKIVGQKIGLHPVWLIFALIVFSYLFGFVGTLVAVPLAAATGVLVRFALKVYLESEYYGAGTANAVGPTETPGKEK